MTQFSAAMREKLSAAMIARLTAAAADDATIGVTGIAVQHGVLRDAMGTDELLRAGEIVAQNAADDVTQYEAELADRADKQKAVTFQQELLAELEKA